MSAVGGLFVAATTVTSTSGVATVVVAAVTVAVVVVVVVAFVSRSVDGTVFTIGSVTVDPALAGMCVRAHGTVAADPTAHADLTSIHPATTATATIATTSTLNRQAPVCGPRARTVTVPPYLGIDTDPATPVK